MCLVFLQTASIWPPSLGRQHKALRRCRLLLQRKWSEWARTSNNSLNECTAQEPYIKTVNVSTLWSCGEPARLHLSAALCGCCPPPPFFAPTALLTVQLSWVCSAFLWLWERCRASLPGLHYHGNPAAGAPVAAEGLHTEKDVCEEGRITCACILTQSHTQFLCHMFVFFVSFHPYSTPAYFLPFSPSSSPPPLLTHTFIICTVMSSSSSFLLIHPFLSLTLCTHTRPHLIAFSLSPLGHTGEARVAASISHWRHKLSPWQQPKVAAACWSFRNPSLCFLYGSVNTCKSFKPYNPCLSLSASLMFLCKDCYLVHRDHSQFKLGTSYRRNIRQVDDRKHKVASPNRYFFMLKAR